MESVLYTLYNEIFLLIEFYRKVLNLVLFFVMDNDFETIDFQKLRFDVFKSENIFLRLIYMRSIFSFITEKYLTLHILLLKLLKLNSKLT